MLLPMASVVQTLAAHLVFASTWAQAQCNHLEKLNATV